MILLENARLSSWFWDGNHLTYAPESTGWLGAPLL